MIQRNTTALIFGLLLSLITLASQNVLSETARPDAQRPNIVFFFVDDMGYGDLGCYGHPQAKTPNIDRLAAQGVRFTQHYSNGPECTPTRTALMTGGYQQRIPGLECAIGTGNVGRYDDAIHLAEEDRLGLPPDKALLPSALTSAGYTAVAYGKWHLGYEPEFHPLRHGWDDFFGFLGGNVDYFTHRELSNLHVLFDREHPVYREGYTTHLITDDAVEFLKRDHDSPFFLYLPHAAPHFPYQTPNDQEKAVTADNWTEGDQPTYVAMLEDLDDQIGRVLQALNDEEYADETLVIFASDNGGTDQAHHSVLRGQKTGLFEGGIRVPLIIRWPGHIEPGTVSDQVSITMDLTRSILRIGGADVPDGRPLDGIDIIRHVEERRPDTERTLFWRSKRGSQTWWAVRDGKMKYVKRRRGDAVDEWLFNLNTDIGESENLAGAKPGTLRRLKQSLAEWEKEIK